MNCGRFKVDIGFGLARSRPPLNESIERAVRNFYVAFVPQEPENLPVASPLPPPPQYQQLEWFQR
jgi:hypothetical protein